MDINCSVITEQAKLEEIRETVKRSEEDKDLVKSIRDFGSPEDFFKFYFDNAKKHDVYMLSVPRPAAGFEFNRFM